MTETLRANLAARMEAGGFSQRALAKEAGIDHAPISRFLNGKADTLALDTTMALAGALGCGVAELLGEAAGGPVTVPLNKLREASALNPRQRFDSQEIHHLADSIAELGLLQPILVKPDKEDPGHFWIVAGSRRVRAITHLLQGNRLPAELQGDHTAAIPAQILEIDQDTHAAIALVENLQRVDLTPIEEAEAFNQLLDLNWTTKRIGTAISKTQRYVQKRLKLLSLFRDALNALNNGTINPTQAHCIAAAPHNLQRVIFDKIVTGDVHWRTEAQIAKQIDRLTNTEPSQPITADDDAPAPDPQRALPEPRDNAPALGSGDAAASEADEPPADAKAILPETLDRIVLRLLRRDDQAGARWKSRAAAPSTDALVESWIRDEINPDQNGGGLDLPYFATDRERLMVWACWEHTVTHNSADQYLVLDAAGLRDRARDLFGLEPVTQSRGTISLNTADALNKPDEDAAPTLTPQQHLDAVFADTPPHRLRFLLERALDWDAWRRKQPDDYVKDWHQAERDLATALHPICPLGKRPETIYDADMANGDPPEDDGEAEDAETWDPPAEELEQDGEPVDEDLTNIPAFMRRGGSTTALTEDDGDG